MFLWVCIIYHINVTEACSAVSLSVSKTSHNSPVTSWTEHCLVAQRHGDQWQRGGRCQVTVVSTPGGRSSPVVLGLLGEMGALLSGFPARWHISCLLNGMCLQVRLWHPTQLPVTLDPHPSAPPCHGRTRLGPGPSPGGPHQGVFG
ncbi:unnamed protein product [Boreogadus saida]